MKKALKWIAIVVGCLLGILVLAGGVLYAMGGSALEASVDTDGETLAAAAADSASLARGAYIVNTHGCVDCHGEGLGGQVLADAPPFIAVASNLTSGQGGIGSIYTDADWERAIRHGVRPDGRGLVIMPSTAYNMLSDDETADLISYLKSLPPVDNELPQTELRALGRIIAATGGLSSEAAHIDHARSHLATAPPHAATIEYGKYRAALCGHCHGADLHGAPPLDPAAPPGPDLYSVTAWSLDDFKKAMRTGVTPSGKELNPQFMPWTAFGKMTDTELEAIYMYISTLEPATDPQTADSRAS